MSGQPPHHPGEFPTPNEPQAPYGSPSLSPYSGMPTINPHRRPVRITVVAILTFVYAATMLFGSLATGFMGSEVAEQFLAGVAEKAGEDSQTPIAPMPVQSLPVFGIDLGATGVIVFGVLVTVALVASGIMLWKRSREATVVFLIVVVVIAVNEVLQIPAAMEYQDRMNEWLQQINYPSGETTTASKAQQEFETVATIIGVVFTLVVKAVLLGLVFSVAKWFRGEPLFGPAGPNQYA